MNSDSFNFVCDLFSFEEQKYSRNIFYNLYAEKEFMMLMHFYGETQLEISKGNCCCFYNIHFYRAFTKK